MYVERCDTLESPVREKKDFRKIMSYFYYIN